MAEGGGEEDGRYSKNNTCTSYFLFFIEYELLPALQVTVHTVQHNYDAPTVVFIQDDMQLHASRGKIFPLCKHAISMIWLVQENEGSERVADLDSWVQLCNFHTQITNYAPFTKTSPNYPHKNNADNSIKIAFTKSKFPKIIYTLFTSGHKKKKKKTWKDGWACGEGVTFDRALEIVCIILELRSQIRSLVPMRLLCG